MEPIGSDFGDPAQRAAPENEVAIDRVVFEPEFSLGPIGLGHDVALAFTEVPLALEPLPLEPQPSPEGLGEATVVGYGVSVTGDGGASAGRRRRGTVTVSGVDALFLELGAGVGPCHGDSGGPVLVTGADGFEHVVGIVSFTDSDCGTGSRATRLAAYLPFIHEELEAARAPTSQQSSCQLARGPASGTAGWIALGVLGPWVARRQAVGRRRRVTTNASPASASKAAL